MKLKIKHITILLLLFSVVIIACNNNPKQNNNSKNQQASSTFSRDSTIVIASLNDGVTTFVADSNILKSDWQKFLTNQPEIGPCELSSIKIVPNVEATTYYLIASGTMSGGKNLKSTIELELEPPTCLSLSSSTTICTTTECSDEQEGCIPVAVACTKCGNSGKCSKTVSNSPVAIFPSIPTGTCQN